MTAFTRLLAALSAVALFVAAPAWACGGFFCFTAPVDQSAERILYVHKDGKMQVHIQISYTGEDQSFSWILPLPKKPESADGIEVSSDTIFQLLEQYTTPQFQLQWKNTNDCMVNRCMAAAAGGGDGTKNGGGVSVLMEKEVGPYSAVVIEGDTGANIVKWLNDNKFVQPKATEGLIDTYAKQKYVFLALKLQKDKSAGDLVPIAVTIAEDSPCLPIQPVQTYPPIVQASETTREIDVLMIASGASLRQRHRPGSVAVLRVLRTPPHCSGLWNDGCSGL